MNRIIIGAAVACLAVMASGCGKNPCKTLVTEVCARAADSIACEAAGKLTVDDECTDYLNNIDKFIELKNTVVTEEGVKPPAVTKEIAPAAAPEAAEQPVAAGEPVQAEEAAPTEEAAGSKATE